MVGAVPWCHDGRTNMSPDLPVILLILGATIVPWLLWAYARGGRDTDTDYLKAVQPRTEVQDR